MQKESAKRKRRWPKVLLIILAVVVVLVLALTMFIGWYAYFGPFKGLSITRIRQAYKDRPQGEIIFYGASNFTMWPTLDEDMLPLAVQNHGFGGSTDDDMMAQADKLLYPYAPSVVVFQSGSNDFVLGMTVAEVCANKDGMYTTFRAELPDATFVVLSMLPLPGRTEYWEQSAQVNAYLKEYCETHDNMYFVDATDAMMTADGGFRPEYYKNDGIHLNAEGQAVWCALIKPVLQQAVS